MSSYTAITQQTSINFGIPVLIAGLMGGLLNTIVFLSLRTFRQNSCAFYLTIMSIVNMGQLMTGLLSRIMISGYGIDWTATSAFYCKFRYFLLQTCTLVSLTCICLATIDQYFATSSNLRWKQWFCQLKIAFCLTVITVIFWLLHGILYLVFFGWTPSAIPGPGSCIILNSIFGLYHVYGYFLTLSGFLPITIMVVFALLAFRNIHRSDHQNVPIVRRELEKQLTTMVLTHVAINSLLLLPMDIISALQRNTQLTSNATTAAMLQTAGTISLFIYYMNFAVSMTETSSEMRMPMMSFDCCRVHSLSTYVYLIDFVANLFTSYVKFVSIIYDHPE